MRTIICSALTALTITTAGAEEVHYTKSATYVLPSCKLVSAERRQWTHEEAYAVGYCTGAIEALFLLAEDARDTPICIDAPKTITPVQAAQVVIRYIEARPERMHEAFNVLALEALYMAWPCKKPQQPRP